MKRSLLFLLMPVALSAFTHIWNPVGFPSIRHDEDTHYIPRAMLFMNGEGLQQDPKFYDHPFFGQIFLAFLFKAVEFPTIIENDESTDVETIRVIYSVPRILMGLLAVLDTFLIYKICEAYNQRAALIASVLFAVMPVTWTFRQVLLDNILMPFLLSSILIAIHMRAINRLKRKQISLTLLSGVFLGLAVFTKFPAFTMIPLVAYLIYLKNRGIRILALWFLPVILMPSLWPAYAFYTNTFDLWMDGVVWQSTGRIHKLLSDAIYRFFEIDPLFLLLGTTGLIYVTYKKEYLALVWILPFFIFSIIIQYVSFFHLSLVLPAFCIASARLIRDLDFVIFKKTRIIIPTLFIIVVLFGIISTTLIISVSATDRYFEALSFVNEYISGTSKYNTADDKITIIGPPGYFWIPKYVYEKMNNNYIAWWDAKITPINTKKVLFVVPYGILTDTMSGTSEQAKKLQQIRNATRVVAVFDPDLEPFPSDKYYPYSSLKESPPNSLKIEIRANY